MRLELFDARALTDRYCERESRTQLLVVTETGLCCRQALRASMAESSSWSHTASVWDPWRRVWNRNQDKSAASFPGLHLSLAQIL